MNYNDLKVSGGRLINDTPEQCEMGITKFARMRKEMKQEKKVAMMTEAMTRAEINSELMESPMPIQALTFGRKK